MLIQSLSVVAALVAASVVYDHSTVTPAAEPSAGAGATGGTSSLGGRPPGGTGGVTPIGGSIAGNKADGPR